MALGYDGKLFILASDHRGSFQKKMFGIPGDYVLGLYKLMESSPIQHVATTREDCAGFAADAYARINGIGALCVTYCVGGLNTVNAIACASRTPLHRLRPAPSPNAESRTGRASWGQARARPPSPTMRYAEPRLLSASERSNGLGRGAARAMASARSYRGNARSESPRLRRAPPSVASAVATPGWLGPSAR